MKIRILGGAEDDLAEGYRFYEEQEGGVGDYFLNTIFSEIESLKSSAGIHRMVFGRYRMLSKVFPYGIFYTLRDDVVEVRAVLDLRRNPGWIRRRIRR